MADDKKPKTDLLAQVGPVRVDNVRRKKKKSIAWDSDPEILSRLDAVSQMVLRGAKLWQIAEALQCSISTAKRDRERVKELWGREASGAVNERRERSIANLRYLQSIAWADYDKSKNSQLLRMIGDWEDQIVKLEGSNQPTEAKLTVTTDERPYKNLSDSELYAALSAKRAALNKRRKASGGSG